jgi:hypothetical protein
MMRKLVKEFALSQSDARDIHERLRLSGFRSWRPWGWMLVLLSVYMYFRFRVWPGHYGKMGEFFMSALFLGAVMGALYLSERMAYPAMRAEAERMRSEQAEKHG